MTHQVRRLVLSIFAALNAGCSTLENYFPDKEKDYQYTSEIPMLNWPAELRKNQSVNSDTPASPEASNLTEIPSPQDSAGANNTAETASSSSGQTGTTAESSKPAVSPAEIVNSESDDRTTISSVEIVKYDDGESRLRLGTAFPKAWRAVSKALSHNAIEVTERNHEQGLITLQYDPNEQKAKDDSFWDELDFFFHGINTKEEEYQLKLEEHNEITDVLVLNHDHLPMLKNENALHLLKVIADTIKTDLAQKDKKAESSESDQK